MIRNYSLEQEHREQFGLSEKENFIKQETHKNSGIKFLIKRKISNQNYCGLASEAAFYSNHAFMFYQSSKKFYKIKSIRILK